MRLSLLKSRCATSTDRFSGERGFVLPIVLLWTFVMFLEVGGLALYAAARARQIQSHVKHTRTFYIAEAAAEKMVAAVRLFVQNQGRAPDAAELAAIAAAAPSVGANFDYDDVDLSLDGAATAGELEFGTYAGLNGVVQDIQISATARTLAGYNSTTVTVGQGIQVQLIPIFQFGVFYEDDLEILPGPAMTFSGPVHSNGDIYLGPHDELSFESSITAYGDVHHGRKDDPDAEMNGDVLIDDADGAAQSMSNGNGTWLDSSDPDWLTESFDRWGGNVLSSAHNTKRLNLPLPPSEEARNLIVRRSAADSPTLQSQKMDYKAHLRIVDGAVLNQAGQAVDLRYCTLGGTIQDNGTPADTSDDTCSAGTLKNPISTTTFYNHREGKTVQSTDLDIDVLNSSPAFQAIAAAAGTGVILYHSDYRNAASPTDQDALRLVNGSQIYGGGMTVVTENPMYVKGNFNSVNKQPTGLMSDAVNLLSNAWSDAASWSSNLSSRTASNTTVKAVVVTGNTETTVGQYNGGFENIHRFLENWSGRTLTYEGSVIVLYASAFAAGDWVYGSPYYTAPRRNWSFDPDLADADYVIPGFPSVYNITKSVWTHD
jgi:hypothetical protein